MDKRAEIRLESLDGSFGSAGQLERWRQRCIEFFKDITYGGFIFWPWKTSLDSSKPTFE